MDSVAVEIGAANDEKCVRLRRALRAVPGFQLVLVEVEHGRTRSEVLRRLKGWIERGDIGAIETISRTPGADLMDLIARHPRGLALLDLDAVENDSLATDLQVLNWERDRLPRLLTGPLILVMDRRGSQRLFELAPDLASWRKHSAHFREPARLDHWTLHDVAPWHSTLAQEYDAMPTPVWRSVLRLHRRIAHASASGVARAIRVRTLLGKHDEAAELYLLARDYFSDLREQTVDSTEEIAAMEVVGVHAALCQDDREAAEARLASARQLCAAIRRDDTRTHLEFMLVDGRFALTAGDFDHARAAYTVAVGLARQRQDATAEVTALVGLAMVAKQLAGDVEMDTWLAEASQRSSSSSTDWLEYYVALARAWVVPGTDEALRHLATAYELAARVGSAEATEVAVRAATVALSLRAVPAARTWAARAALASSPSAPAWLQQTYWRVLAWLARQGGELRLATEYYLRARAVAPASASAPLDEVIGQVALEAGSTPDALEAFRRARTSAAARSDEATLARAEVGIGRALMMLGEQIEEGASGVRRAIALFEQLSLRLEEISARRLLAQLLESLGRSDEAVAQRRRATAIEEDYLGIAAMREAEDREREERKAIMLQPFVV